MQIVTYRCGCKRVLVNGVPTAIVKDCGGKSTCIFDRKNRSLLKKSG